MKSRMRSEIEEAEAARRRGILVGLLAGVAFWAAVIMLLVAMGMAR